MLGIGKYTLSIFVASLMVLLYVILASLIDIDSLILRFIDEVNTYGEIRGKAIYIVMIVLTFLLLFAKSILSIFVYNIYKANVLPSDISERKVKGLGYQLGTAFRRGFFYGVLHILILYAIFLGVISFTAVVTSILTIGLHSLMPDVHEYIIFWLLYLSLFVFFYFMQSLAIANVILNRENALVSLGKSIGMIGQHLGKFVALLLTVLIIYLVTSVINIYFISTHGEDIFSIYGLAYFGINILGFFVFAFVVAFNYFLIYKFFLDTASIKDFQNRIINDDAANKSYNIYFEPL